MVMECNLSSQNPITMNATCKLCNLICVHLYVIVERKPKDLKLNITNYSVNQSTEQGGLYIQGIYLIVCRVVTPNITIVITDGASHSRQDTISAAKALQKHSVIIFAVGVKGAVERELNGIASKLEYVFSFSGYDDLKNAQQKLEMQHVKVCDYEHQNECGQMSTHRLWSSLPLIRDGFKQFMSVVWLLFNPQD